MQQGLIDILDQAKKQAKQSGELTPYSISCMTLINILKEHAALQRAARDYVDACKLAAETKTWDDLKQTDKLFHALVTLLPQA